MNFAVASIVLFSLSVTLGISYMLQRKRKEKESEWRMKQFIQKLGENQNDYKEYNLFRGDK